MGITNLLKTRLASLLIAALCASIAVPAVAGAQQVSPTDSQYGSQLNQVNQGTQVNQGADAGTASADSASGLGGNVGPLPFTGFDVIAMLAVALAVAGLGLALQRAVSHGSSEN